MMHRVLMTVAASLLAGCATVDLNAPVPIAGPSAATISHSSSLVPLPSKAAADTGVIVHEVSIATPTVRPMAPYPGDLARSARVPDAPGISSGASSSVQEEQSGSGYGGSANGKLGHGSPAAGEVTPDGILLLPPKAVPGK